MSNKITKFEGEHATVIIDDGGIAKAFQALDALLDDATPVMQGVQALMLEDIEQHFSKQSGPPGKWKSLKKSTLLNRRKGAKGAKILQDTGLLRASIVNQNAGTVTRDTALVSTNLVYASTHNFGRGVIPQREFMWLSKKAIDKIENLVLDQAEKAWAK